MNSREELRIRSGYDRRKMDNLYGGWDKAAKKKDFEECERIERQIKNVHDKHGIKES